MVRQTQLSLWVEAHAQLLQKPSPLSRTRTWRLRRGGAAAGRRQVRAIPGGALHGLHRRDGPLRALQSRRPLGLAAATSSGRVGGRKGGRRRYAGRQVDRQTDGTRIRLRCSAGPGPGRVEVRLPAAHPSDANSDARRRARPGGDAAALRGRTGRNGCILHGGMAGGPAAWLLRPPWRPWARARRRQSLTSATARRWSEGRFPPLLLRRRAGCPGRGQRCGQL
jgi:hypothetical protein